MTSASTEPFLMNWVLFHFPYESLIFISWASESHLTAIASKLQSKNPRRLIHRAENGPVL